MRIAIVGGGAMGCLFAARLTFIGLDVLLVVRRPETADRINKTGVRVDGSNGSLTQRVKVLADATGQATADLVILLVKTTRTSEALIGCMPLIGPDTLVMTLQNGLGNAERLAEVIGKDQIIVGTTAHGSTLLAPGHIRHSGEGLTSIGAYGRIDQSRLLLLKTIFENAGFSTVVDNDVLRQIWQKLIINAGINALTAILNVPNGHLAESENSRQIMRSLVCEAVSVAESQGFTFDRELCCEKCIEVARNTAANISSMLQDIRAGRPTEIGGINGRIIELGERAGVPVPVNNAVTRLVRLLEEAGRHHSSDQP